MKRGFKSADEEAHGFKSAAVTQNLINQVEKDAAAATGFNRFRMPAAGLIPPDAAGTVTGFNRFGIPAAGLIPPDGEGKDMPFWRSYAHLIWATKDRQPLIRPEIEAELFASIVSKAAELDCYVHAVNGTEDHVHVVISIPPKLSVAWVVKNLKGNSSHFVNHAVTPPAMPFAWQRGYGYLSFGNSRLEQAIAYVENQKAHHQAQKTNSWLERTDDDGEDDGRPPENRGPGGFVREPAATYSLDDLPF